MSHLKDYAAPVLVVEEKQDVISIETAQSLASSFFTAHLVLIDRCSHYPWIDNPEPYFSQVESFLGNKP